MNTQRSSSHPSPYCSFDPSFSAAAVFSTICTSPAALVTAW